MEQKNRMIFSIAVILLIFCALLVSFGRMFRLETPEVVLPSVDSSVPGAPGPSDGPGHTALQTVSVTPDTVQSVIATLNREDSYYRELHLEQFWSSGLSSTTIQTWMDGDWLRSSQTLPSGAVRHDLIGPDTAYYWYDGSSQYESAPADAYSADLAQRLPTYETVLELDPASITAAGYESKGDIPCIFVESVQDDAVYCYWVSVDSGLLVCAELTHQDTVLYRINAFSSIQSPCPASASFQLPDGTVLHTP